MLKALQLEPILAWPTSCEKRLISQVLFSVASFMYDFMIVGPINKFRQFMRKLTDSFEVRTTYIGEIVFGQKKSMHVQAIAKYQNHSTPVGIIMYLSSAVVPQSALIAPRMQQRLRDITIKHLKDAQSMFQ